ncbi:MAG: mevalonate kinase [Oceanospirillaceae bacterium]|jgi:mevalonate kinase
MNAPDSVSSPNSPATPAWSPSSGVPCTRVRVPGKVILSGEHAVVYGAPALACAIQKYAFAKVTSGAFDGVHLKVPEFGIDQQFSNLQLSKLAQQTQSRHQQFLTHAASLSSVVSNPEEFFAAAIGASGLVYLLPNQHAPASGLTIKLTMDLVAGGGMGSSAALVAAMLAASFKHLGKPLTPSELISKTIQSEHWQHGRSSGLDPYVCVMGGFQQYQKGYGERQILKQLAPYFLVTTGKPLSSTGECVEAVKQQNFPLSLWDRFGAVQQNLLTAMCLNQHTRMLEAIQANHQLLHQIGVVPKAVAEFIGRVETHGGAAKVCGAGSVAGDHGGLVFAMGVEQSDLEQLGLSYGYGVQDMLPDLEGVFYFD